MLPQDRNSLRFGWDVTSRQWVTERVARRTPALSTPSGHVRWRPVRHDVAIEASDITLMSGRLSGVRTRDPNARRAHCAPSTGSLGWAFGCNTAVPLARWRCEGRSWRARR